MRCLDGSYFKGLLFARRFVALPGEGLGMRFDTLVHLQPVETREGERRQCLGQANKRRGMLTEDKRTLHTQNNNTR